MKLALALTGARPGSVAAPSVTLTTAGLLPNVYLANMDSIVPWDRGTNYAIELGEKAAETILVS